MRLELKGHAREKSRPPPEAHTYKQYIHEFEHETQSTSENYHHEREEGLLCLHKLLLWILAGEQRHRQYDEVKGAVRERNTIC